MDSFYKSTRDVHASSSGSAWTVLYFIMSDTQVFILLHFLPILKPPNVFVDGKIVFGQCIGVRKQKTSVHLQCFDSSGYQMHTRGCKGGFSILKNWELFLKHPSKFMVISSSQGAGKPLVPEWTSLFLLQMLRIFNHVCK